MSGEIVKVGDHHYSMSLQREHASYSGFPQRELYLLEALMFRQAQVRHCHHDPITDNSGSLRMARSQVRGFFLDCKARVAWIDNPLSILALLDVDVPVLFDCVDWYAEMVRIELGNVDQERLVNRALRLAFERADLVVFQSQFMKDYYGIDGEVIPNGYNESLFRSINDTPLHCIGEQEGKALFIGKLGMWYSNLLVVADACERIGMELHICGDGELREALEKKPATVMHGFVKRSEVADHIWSAEVCVMPVDDCSPIVTSEYLGAGKAIVHRGYRIKWLLPKILVSGTEESWMVGLRYARNHRAELERANTEIGKGLSWSSAADKFLKTLEKLDDCHLSAQPEQGETVPL